MNCLIRPDLYDFKAYCSARDNTVEGKIWLNANESPFDDEINGIKLNRYPEKQLTPLQDKLAYMFNVKNNQIAISRGSDEMIDLLIRLFCVSGEDSILICPPTYGMYAVYAKLQGASVIEIPLEKNNQFKLDLNSIIEINNKNIKLIFLCSPNNPTGNLLNSKDILFLCKTVADKSIVVIDEAYIEFSDSTSFSQSINEIENLVVLRTLSKAYGLANARVGILISNQTIIEWILKLMAPYPLSDLVTKLVLEKLSSSVFLSTIKQKIICIKREREKLIKALEEIKIIQKIWPSDSNFLLIESSDSKKIINQCYEKGIILRQVSLNNAIRISIGLPEENTRLIEVLREIK